MPPKKSRTAATVEVDIESSVDLVPTKSPKPVPTKKTDVASEEEDDDFVVDESDADDEEDEEYEDEESNLEQMLSQFFSTPSRTSEDEMLNLADVCENIHQEMRGIHKNLNKLVKHFVG